MQKTNDPTEPLELEIHRRKSYRYYVKSGLRDELSDWLTKHAPGERVFLVLDENVDHYHGSTLVSAIKEAGHELHTWTVPSGESSKNLDRWRELIDFMLEHRVQRSSPLIAAGGGVTGDLAGFAASVVLRGIPLVHLPTTLLAMVDSSIGGKTGVNHATGKNLVGAFYQPEVVMADVDLLATLERKEWINGLAEVIKYGAIRDPNIFEHVSELVDNKGFEEPSDWIPLIHDSAAIKMDIVRQDELESGKRAFLNFGHTFGHAIEKVAGYGAFSHGEAVFAGMIAAIYASRKLGADLSPATFDPFMPLYPLPMGDLRAQQDELTAAMRQDKKVQRDQIRLVLLQAWGEPYIHRCDGEHLIDEAWNAMFEHFEAARKQKDGQSRIGNRR